MTIWLQRGAMGGMLLFSACAMTPSADPTLGVAPLAVFHVGFATGASSLDPEGEKTVGSVARYMLANPATHASVIGRSDTAGALASNELLSRKRAETVRDALVAGRHIGPERLETHWTGEMREALAVGLDDPSAANRVVDVTIR